MTEEQFNIKMGKLIRSARKVKGFSQTDLAEVLGVSRVTVVNIEGGRNSTTCFKMGVLCSILEIDLKVLIPPDYTMKAANEAYKRIKHTAERNTDKINRQINTLNKQLETWKKISEGQ